VAAFVKRSLLPLVPLLLGDRPGLFLTRRWCQGLEKELCGQATDKFLELLLRAMEFPS
jgi:hypothetical protein